MPRIAPQHAWKDKDHAPSAEWPEDCLVQWGSRGVVLSSNGSYRTAFFKAFPGDCFIRGEGATIAEAEGDALAKWRKISSCKEHAGKLDFSSRRSSIPRSANPGELPRVTRHHEYRFEADPEETGCEGSEFVALFRLIPGRRRASGRSMPDTVEIIDIYRFEDDEREEVDADDFVHLCVHLEDFEEEMLEAAEADFENEDADDYGDDDN